MVTSPWWQETIPITTAKTKSNSPFATSPRSTTSRVAEESLEGETDLLVHHSNHAAPNQPIRMAKMTRIGSAMEMAIMRGSTR